MQNNNLTVTPQLPHKLTPQVVKTCKHLIQMIMQMKCSDLQVAALMASTANSISYMLHEHKMPGLWIRGPYITKGHRIIKDPHIPLETYGYDSKESAE